MLKTRKKWISVLLTLAMLVGLMVPLAAPAAAATSGYEALDRNIVVDDDSVDALSSVLIEVRAGALDVGDEVILSLPDGFKFLFSDDTDDVITDWDSVSQTVYNNFDVPSTYDGNDNGLGAITVTPVDDNQVKVKVDTCDSENPAYLIFNMGKVYIDEDYEGDITLTAEAPSGSGFPSDEVVVGKVGGGDASIAVKNDPTFSEDTTSDPIKIRIKENIKGALAEGEETFKLSLPDGFEWVRTDYNVDVIWGDTDVESDLTATGWGTDELEFNLAKETDSATYFELTLNIQVADENEAEPGDVKVKVGGESDITPTEIVVGSYGEYDVTVEADSAPEVYAGMLEQEIGDILIKEAVGGSLVEGRTIILTLPSNAKWGAVDDAAEDGSRIEFQDFVGSDGRSIKYKVVGESTGGSKELKLEDMEVVLEPGVTGDLEIEVSGTAVPEGTITVAKVLAPVSISAASKADVKIGLTAQAAGDLTITEGAAGAIKEGEDLIIDLPDGVKFTKKPKVEVTSGDLDIDFENVKLQDNDNALRIPIDNDSNEASTIAITDVQYSVDRTVVEGDITVKVKGSAVVEVNDEEAISSYFGTAAYDDVNDKVMFKNADGENIEGYEIKDDGIFPSSGTAAKTVNAAVVTPAPPDTKQTASFIIGSTTYTVNGVENTMDVAPYVTAAGRTYVPVRYLAYALGVSQENIYWDEATRTVTLLKGTTAIQLTIGSNVIKVNGVSLTMDVAPEIKDGRTMLPARFVAQALGATVGYDEANQTVTIEM